MPKRTNKPGISTTNRPPRGRGGFRARGGRGRGFGGRYVRRSRGDTGKRGTILLTEVLSNVCDVWERF